MDNDQRKEIVEALREEVLGYFAWVLDELGEEYFIKENDQPFATLEIDGEERITKKIKEKNVLLWERDLYAFLAHPQRPSVYGLLEADDLEIIHYPETVYCDHFKAEAALDEQGGPAATMDRQYDQPFGVLLASTAIGWMYRLDFCEVCGMVEIWSRAYSPEEVAIYSELSSPSPLSPH